MSLLQPRTKENSLTTFNPLENFPINTEASTKEFKKAWEYPKVTAFRPEKTIVTDRSIDFEELRRKFQERKSFDSYRVSEWEKFYLAYAS